MTNYQWFSTSSFSAHEITHAFDDSGINYDRDGRAGQLYDNQTLDGFIKEANCLREQYFKYSIAGEIIHYDFVCCDIMMVR